MNTEAISAKLEDQLVAQGRLAGVDSGSEQVVEALLAGLGPAIRQAQSSNSLFRACLTTSSVASW